MTTAAGVLRRGGRCGLALGTWGTAVRDLERWLTPGRFFVLLGLAVAALYPDVVVGSHSFFYRDYGAFGYPLAAYHRQAFWEGTVPLWNPFNNCGLPFMAQWNTMVWYPLSWVYVVLPLPWSLNYFCLVHVVLAGWAMFLLARRWFGSSTAAAVAGLGYALNGVTLQSLMWPNNVAALAWMPLVVLLMERACQEGGRWILWAAGLGAVQFLAGAPEVVLFTWGVVAGLWGIGVVRSFRGGGETWGGWSALGRGAWRCGLVGLLVAGLTAVQMLPFLELVSSSHRGRDFEGGAWAMPGWGWANLLVPLFRCTASIAGVYSQDEQQWTSSYYLGVGVLALAIWALWRCGGWRVWYLGAIALFGLIMALGGNSPAYGWVKGLVPVLGFARFPVKFVVLAVFAVPLLAACAVAGRERWGRREEQWRWFGLGGALSLLILGLIWFSARHPAPAEEWEVTCSSGLTRWAFLAAILGIVGRWNALAKRGGAGWLGVALLVLVGADGWTHTPRQNPTVESWVYDPGLHLAPTRPVPGETRAMISPYCRLYLDQAATPDPEEYYMGHRRVLFENGNLLERAETVGGFYSLYTREQRQVWELLYRDQRTVPEPLLDFMGVTQLSSDERLFAWIGRTGAMDRVSAGQRPVFADESATLAGLGEADFDPREQVYLPEDARGVVRADGRGSARILSWRVGAAEVEAEVEAEGPAVVTVAQSFYPAWTAWVDGERVRLWRANHAFQALEVPPGRHRIRVVYEDRWFRLGAGVTVATVLMGVGCWWVLARRGAGC